MANPYYQSAVPPYLGQPTTVPNYTQMQPTMQPQQQTNSLLTIFVNSEEEVNYYPVAAGVTVLLVSFNLGKFYVKSTGKNGVPEPLRVFNFTEETTHMVNQNEGQFVTKSDLDAVTDKLNKLIESLGGESNVQSVPKHG